MQNKIYTYGIAFLLALLVLGGLVWIIFFRSTPTSTAPSVTDLFGTSANTTTGVTPSNTGSNTNQPIASSGQVSKQKVFEITAGPIAGATLIQTLHPTTTLARYVSQEDGHVYDLALDVAGSVPRMVSHVTIPGASRTIWVEQGNAVILQYLDGSTVKSVYLGLPVATTSTKTVATRIQFLPDNIVDLAASPDGTSLVYMLKTSSGSDGYIARSDGTGAKKLFSLPLSQVLVSWPSQTTLLAQTKSATGVPGMVFSIDAKSGSATTMLYSQGVTATANPTFAYMVYQPAVSETSAVSTYVRDIKNGLNANLSFSPLPEKCIWSSQTSTVMYCAAPLLNSSPHYLDLWHQGVAGSADSILYYNIINGVSNILALPGSSDGGVASDILELSLSPNEKYLSFTARGSRTLWGVRLTQ